MTGETRRAALIATAVTLPILVLVALLLTLGHSGTKDQNDPLAKPRSNSGPLPALTVTAPPSSAATATPCTAVLEALPVSLAGLAPRIVHSQPDSPYVVAWGDPAIVLRCGVARPAGLSAGSTNNTQIVNGVLFFVVNPDDGSDKSPVWTFTVVDRAAYVELTVPKSYGQPPLGPIADAVSKALPAAVCLPQSAPGQAPPPENKLCTHRL